ncbi:uncharacterized protein G2W53_016904 [Senna tora]|uniref:Uncharacterized protein n=1 Tax=Senna tora TaxID=362788 RepID=A0A834WJP0_9FABA|nr:uncharacterized protein G2W53_016904 [Senna tora]
MESKRDPNSVSTSTPSLKAKMTVNESPSTTTSRIRRSLANSKAARTTTYLFLG